MFLFFCRFNGQLSSLPFLLHICSSLDALRLWFSNLNLHQNPLVDLLKQSAESVRFRGSAVELRI